MISLINVLLVRFQTDGGRAKLSVAVFGSRCRNERRFLQLAVASSENQRAARVGRRNVETFVYEIDAFVGARRDDDGSVKLAAAAV